MLTIAFHSFNHWLVSCRARWHTHCLIVRLALPTYHVLNIWHLSLKYICVVRIGQVLLKRYACAKGCIARWLVFQIILLKFGAVGRLEHLGRRLRHLKLWRDVRKRVSMRTYLRRASVVLDCTNGNLAEINVSLLILLMHNWLWVDVRLGLVRELRQFLRRQCLTIFGLRVLR